MEGSNLRNFKLIVLMALVVTAIFTYVLVENNVEDSIFTNIKEVGLGE